MATAPPKQRDRAKQARPIYSGIRRGWETTFAGRCAVAPVSFRLLFFMKNWLRLVLLLTFYGLLFVVFTWPLAANCGSSFLVVPKSDSYVFYWNVWHFREALLHGQNAYFTDWLFFPRGSGLVMHTYTPIMGLLNVVLANAPLAINAVLFLSYALSGAGAYLLARRWVKSSLLCLLAGFVFAYSPYKLERLPEHYTLVLTATVPFYILLFLRAFIFEEGRWLPAVRSWRAVAGCLALGLFTVFCDYYVLFGLIYFSLLYAAWFWFRMGRIRWQERRSWLWLGGVLVSSHIIIRLLRRFGVDDNSGFWWAGDVVSYFTPPANSRFLHGPWAERLLHNAKVYTMPGSIENTVFIGYALPLLALVLWAGRVAGRRPASQRFADVQGRPLAWVLLVFLLFTVPSLRIYGHEQLNLPTAFVHFIPFFNNIRCPTRWSMMVGLLLPILTFSALEAAWNGRQLPASQAAWSVLLAAVVLLEFWPRSYQRVSLASIPPVYSVVAALPGTTLIPIPLGIRDGFKQTGVMLPEQMFYQTLHHKKLPTGYISRLPAEYFASLDQEPVLHALLQLQSHPDTVLLAPPGSVQVQAFLRAYAPAAFVISPDYRNRPVHQYLRQLLQPSGYREQLVGGYVLFAPPSK